MFASALIVFREVLEAALIIGVVMAASRGAPRRGVFVLAGIGAGILGACIVAALAGEIADAAQGMGQELLNASILGAAVVMLGWHNVWMSRHGRQMARELTAVGQKVALGAVPLWALATAVGLAVLREGSEIVLFLFGVSSAGTEPLPMLAGSVAGLAAGAALGMLLYFGLLRIPMRHFFSITGALILFLTAGLAAQAAGFLVQAGMLPSFADPLWDSSSWVADDSLAGQLLHALIGYTARPSGIQALFYFITLIAVGGLMRIIGRTQAPTGRVAAAAVTAIAASGLLGLPAAERAHAAPFKVYSPTVVKGESEVEYRGYRDFDDDQSIDGGEKHLFAVGHSFTDWWLTEFYWVWEKEPGGKRESEGWEWENKFQIGEPGRYFADFGLLTEIEKPSDEDLYEIKIAPIIEKQIGAWLLTGNLFFEREIGSDSGSGTTFAYAARIRYLLDPHFEPAIEFFGEPGKIGHWGAVQQQEHWAGPAVYGAFALAPGQKLKYSTALLLGETSASSDQRLVLRLEYEFY